MPLAREDRFSLLCHCLPEDRAWFGIVRCTVVPPGNPLEEFWLRLAAPFAGFVFCEKCCRVVGSEQCEQNGFEAGSMTLTGLAHILQSRHLFLGCSPENRRK